MLKEFKAFVNQGNALDLAVGVIVGAAFGKIVNSMVNDVIMPIIGLITGGVDFANRDGLGSRRDAPPLTGA